MLNRPTSGLAEQASVSLVQHGLQRSKGLVRHTPFARMLLTLVIVTASIALALVTS